MKGKHNTERRVNFTPPTRLSDKLQGEQLIKPKVQLYSTYFENHKKRLPPRSNLKITVKARDCVTDWRQSIFQAKSVIRR